MMCCKAANDDGVKLWCYDNLKKFANFEFFRFWHFSSFFLTGGYPKERWSLVLMYKSILCSFFLYDVMLWRCYWLLHRDRILRSCVVALSCCRFHANDMKMQMFFWLHGCTLHSHKVGNKYNTYLNHSLSLKYGQYLKYWPFHSDRWILRDPNFNSPESSYYPIFG